MNQETDDLFKGYGTLIKLKSNFNVIRETLTRIGIASAKKKTLTQTCHIFHRQGEYALMHFKELLAFDGKDVTISEDDETRRNMIALLLEEWNLIEIDETISLKEGEQSMLKVKIVSSAEKNEWQLIQKYTIGRKNKKT